MQYKPNKITKNTWILIALGGSIALCAYVFLLFSIGYSVINQIILMISLCYVVLTLVRYILVDYVYSVNDDGYLTVTRVYGKNNKTLADIKITPDDRIVSTKEEMAAIGKVRHIENFAASKYPVCVYYYVYKNGDYLDALRLECGEDVAKIIKDAIDNSTYDE